MMRDRRFGVWVLVACCLWAAGCAKQTKDAEVERVLADLDAFTKELVSKVETAENPSAGVDEAQKFLDAKRGEMTARLKTLREMRAGELKNGEELKGKVMESTTNDLISVTSLQGKYIGQSMQDPAFKEKLERLVADYQSLFKT